MCIKTYPTVMGPILDPMHKQKKQIENYIFALYQKLVQFLKSRNCFRYVPDNDIEGDIFGWTPSSVSLVPS